MYAMRFRKLRIAWSVAWGVVAVLLCALWARSYWQSSLILYEKPTGYYQLSNTYGVLFFTYTNNAVPMVVRKTWSYHTREPIRPYPYSGFTEGGGMQFIFPFWLLLIFAVAILIAPWIPWSKRFGVRSVLIATSVVGVLLGAVILAFRK
jgi:hypothetical protein